MNEAPILLAWERLTTELMAETRRFTASFRHNLTQYINQILLDGLCLLSELPYRRVSDKKAGLQRLDILITQLRVLLRQCYAQKALGERKYSFHQSRINEIGKMLGGWLKYLDEQSAQQA